MELVATVAKRAAGGQETALVPPLTTIFGPDPGLYIARPNREFLHAPQPRFQAQFRRTAKNRRA